MFNTKPVETLEEGIRQLLAVHQVKAEGWSLEEGALRLEDGRRVPLLPWRVHMHNTAIRNFSCGDKIRFGASHATAMPGPSAFRLLYAGPKDEDLSAMLLRELDMSEWLLDARTVQVFAMQNGNVLHVTTRLDNGVSCTLELSCVMPEGSDPVYKHELTTENGLVTDRAVDTTVTPHGMYLLNAEGTQAFDELDTLTYGLSPAEAVEARAAFALLSGAADPDEYIRVEARLIRLCALVKRSAETGEVIDTREVNA